MNFLFATVAMVTYHVAMIIIAIVSVNKQSSHCFILSSKV